MKDQKTARTLYVIQGYGLPRSCDEQFPVESVAKLGRSIDRGGQWECTVIVAVVRWWGATQYFEVYVSHEDYETARIHLQNA